MLVANWVLAAVLVATSGLWLATTLSGQPFSAATSLPFALCDIAALVAAGALVTRKMLLVEVTYFWGLAGTLQAAVFNTWRRTSAQFFYVVPPFVVTITAPCVPTAMPRCAL